MNVNTHNRIAPAALPPMTSDDQRRLSLKVLASTDEVVQYALQGAWEEMFDVVERRRALLQTLHEFSMFSGVDSSLAALTAAVTESEKAVTRVVAHAIISARRGSRH